MNLPPVALITGLEMFPSRLHYPAPLMELWRNSTVLGKYLFPLPSKLSEQHFGSLNNYNFLLSEEDKSPPEERHEAHETVSFIAIYSLVVVTNQLY